MKARDIFAIPVTIVASESAFSISGRVLSDHRSRLTPKTLEVLMCAQNWLRVGQEKGTNNNSLNLLYVVVTCKFCFQFTLICFTLTYCRKRRLYGFVDLS
jgi:hypothetical protein